MYARAEYQYRHRSFISIPFVTTLSLIPACFCSVLFESITLLLVGLSILVPSFWGHSLFLFLICSSISVLSINTSSERVFFRFFVFSFFFFSFLFRHCSFWVLASKTRFVAMGRCSWTHGAALGPPLSLPVFII